MAIIKCKMCGGDLNLIEGASTAECEFCGSIQTIPNLDDEKKLIQFERAERLRRQCEFDKAVGIYESIVADFRQEAEAYWGLVLCKYGIEYVDDPATGKKIPTCHRSSFDSIMDDGDFEQALENADGIARKIYREEAKAIEEIRKGIIAVSNNEKPYDIFICYKETAENGERTLDSVLAQDVYDVLTDKGYRVFFSRITLEDKLGMEYEPYIFAALNSAKIMLAFGTDYEYFNAVWVKNEWSRFLKLMARDKEKHLIPCYKGIDAYDMPKEFARLQAQNLGKVGAIQDLLRGIEKLLPKQAKTTVVIQENASIVGSDSAIESYLKRATMAVEDGEWDKAEEFCEQALNIDPENAQVYLIKLFAEVRVKEIDQLASAADFSESNSSYKKLLRFADETLKDILAQHLEESKDKKLRDEILVKRQAAEAYFVAHAQIENGILIRYSGTETYACIPESVIRIGASAFSENKTLIAVTIPESITSIGECAFVKCENLASVTIPESVTSIGKSAFALCENLISVTIPESVTDIGDFAFEACKALTSVTIPDGVISIGDGAFMSCEALTSVTIPESVISIGDRAFSCCNALTTVTIPDSVTSIGSYAFASCKLLASVRIPANVSEMGGNPFSGCSDELKVIIDETNEIFRIKDGYLINVKTKTIVSCLGNATIPNDGSVINIGDSAFSGCKTLTTVTIPDGVISIGDSAFSGCKTLTTVTIPDGVISIGDSVFWGCEALTTVTIPGSVTSIGERAFSYCKALTSVTIPESVTSIGKSAFALCENLISVTIPESVTDIGDFAFEACKALTSVTIPDSVTSIGGWAFSGCEALTTVTIPGSVTSIGNYAFDSCQSLTSAIIQEGVTSVGSYAFSHCNVLTTVTIPNSVISIEDSAFSHCNALTTVTIPGSATSIGNYAFDSCQSLTSAIIQEGVTSIGSCAFYSCQSLTSVTIPESVTSIDRHAFLGCNVTVLTPVESAAWNWAKKHYIKVEEDERSKQARLEAEKTQKAEEERIAKEKREAEEQIARQQKVLQEEAERTLRQKRRNAGLCQHCGGELKGLFTKKCVFCGRPKDY